MEATLSPREIQNRIRRGESPEQVAEASGMSVERLRGFAISVIACFASTWAFSIFLTSSGIIKAD